MPCTTTSKRHARSIIGSAGCARSWEPRRTTSCRLRNTPPRLGTWCGRLRPHVPCSMARPISNARTGWCKPSRRSSGCGTRSSMRRSRSSTRGWRPTEKPLPDSDTGWRERGAMMATRVRRRTFLKGTAAAAAAASLQLPAIAEAAPVKIGLLTVKTGPLAQGGIQMEQGINLFLKHRDNKLAGRKAELIVADTGGNPAGTKTKAQELIERDHVDFILGPLAAFELLAISDYATQ